MNRLARPKRSPIRRYCGIAALTLVLMTAAALLLGRTLGSFFAGLALFAILMPLTARQRNHGDILSAACITDAIAAVWLVLAFTDPQLRLWNWLAAYVLLLSVALAQWGLLMLLRRYISSAANAVAILLTMLWLSSPIWLLHHLQSAARLPWMQRLIDVHPLFAMNAVVPLAIWTESPMTYQLMNLNQDVPYTMPAGPWRAIALHAGVGILCCLIWIKASKRQAG